MQLVSVVIPTKNRRSLLEKALNSVYRQTYPNIEILVVNDNSTDDTSNFLYNEITKGKRIKELTPDVSKGAAYARNLGILQASGQFVAFLDDDDEWLPTKIELQLAKFEDPEVGLVYTGAEIVVSDLGFSYYSKPTLQGYIFDDLLIENYIGTTNTVILRANIAKRLMFDINLAAREEYDLWLRVAKRWKIAGLPEPLTKVYSRNSLKRITNNVNSYVDGINYINQKFDQDIRRLTNRKKKMRASAQLFFLGSQSVKANNIKLARRYFLKSVLVRPSVKSFISLLASLGGIKTITNLRRLK